MPRDRCSHADLQLICLHNLKRIEGFEHVTEILVQYRDIQRRDLHRSGTPGQSREAPLDEAEEELEANWTLAAVRPRVDNKALRAARSMIEWLQQTYQLDGAERPSGVKSTRKTMRSPAVRSLRGVKIAPERTADDLAYQRSRAVSMAERPIPGTAKPAPAIDS